jgi:hypothetical protein
MIHSYLISGHGVEYGWGLHPPHNFDTIGNGDQCLSIFNDVQHVTYADLDTLDLSTATIFETQARVSKRQYKNSTYLEQLQN